MAEEEDDMFHDSEELEEVECMDHEPSQALGSLGDLEDEESHVYEINTQTARSEIDSDLFDLSTPSEPSQRAPVESDPSYYPGDFICWWKRFSYYNQYI